jgi:hypothetical protein
MTARTKAAFYIKNNISEGDITIDGFIFDRGEANYYVMRKDDSSYHEGLLTGRIGGVGEGDQQKGLPPCIFDPFVKNRVEGHMTVANCAFVNGAYYGVEVSARKGVTIDNCIFVAVQMAAVECMGTLRNQKSEVVVKNSTLLFIWPRTKTLEDMGYGIRWRSGTNITIERNVIGCCYMGGIDFGHTVNMRDGEKSTVEDNLFFANTGGDMNVTAGNNEFLHIFAEDFGDVEQITNLGDNKTLSDPQGLKQAIDKTYLDYYLKTSSKAKNNFDRTSPNNQFRSAMGMNLDGGVEKITVSMFNNRYPLEKALQLFGVVKGYGAQK